MDYDDYKKESQTTKTKWIDFRKDYVPKLIIITCLSLFAASILGTIIFFHDFYHEFGFMLVVSKS